MSVRWFGAEKWFFKLEQVRGGVHPECNCTMQLYFYSSFPCFHPFWYIPQDRIFLLLSLFSVSLSHLPFEQFCLLLLPWLSPSFESSFDLFEAPHRESKHSYFQTKMWSNIQILSFLTTNFNFSVASWDIPRLNVLLYSLYRTFRNQTYDSDRFPLPFS